MYGCQWESTMFDNRSRRHPTSMTVPLCVPANVAANTSDLSGYPNERRQLLLLSTRDSRFSRRHVMNRNCPREPGRTRSTASAKGEKDVRALGAVRPIAIPLLAADMYWFNRWQELLLRITRHDQIIHKMDRARPNK